MPAGDPLTYAVDAERNLEGLATELAKAGADDKTVAVVTEMAETTRKIVKVLGKGQAQTADNAPPAPEPQPRTIDEATNQLHSDMQRSASDSYR